MWPVGGPSCLCVGTSKQSRSLPAMELSVTGTLDGETIHVDSIAPNKRAANSKPKNYISRSLTPVSSLPVSLPLSAPERFRPLHPKRSSTTSDRRGQHQS